MGLEEMIPAELTVTSGGQNVPLRDTQLIKETPDVATLAKRFYETHQGLHSRLPIPNGDAKPEDIEKWRKEHLPKLINAKVIDPPRQLPEKYEIKKPEGLPEGAWNESLEQEAHAWAKKHGLSQEALNEGLGLYLKTFAGFAEPIERDRKAAAQTLLAKIEDRNKKDPSRAITPEQFDAGVKRWTDQHITDESFRKKLADAGLADDPDIAWFIYELAEQSGTFDYRGANENTEQAGDTDIEEARRIKFDPNHPQWKDYQNEPSDGPLHQKVDAAYKKKFGTAPPPLG